MFRGEAGEASVAIKPRLVVTTAEAAVDAARAGFGITRVLSYQAADDHCARRRCCRLLPAYEGDDIPIHLLYPGGRHPPPKLRAFLDFAVPRLRRRCEAIGAGNANVLSGSWRDERRHLSCHLGGRFSTKAEMPSSASRASMFSTMTSAV